MKQLQIMTYVFFTAVAGVVVSIGMSVYTDVRAAKEKYEAPSTIPAPAR